MINGKVVNIVLIINHYFLFLCFLLIVNYSNMTWVSNAMAAYDSSSIEHIYYNSFIRLFESLHFLVNNYIFFTVSAYIVTCTLLVLYLRKRYSICILNKLIIMTNIILALVTVLQLLFIFDNTLSWQVPIMFKIPR